MESWARDTYPLSGSSPETSAADLLHTRLRNT